MITIEEGIVYKFRNTAGITALISTRIYEMKLPQTVTLPAVTYQRISTPRVLTHDQTAAGLAYPRFQFTIWAESYATVKGIAKAIRDALQGFSGTFGTGSSTVKVNGILPDDERDNYDPETGLYWITVDYIIYHQE